MVGKSVSLEDIDRRLANLESMLGRLVDYTPPEGGYTDTSELARQILSGNGEYLRQHNRRFRESQRQGSRNGT